MNIALLAVALVVALGALAGLGYALGMFGQSKAVTSRAALRSLVSSQRGAAGKRAQVVEDVPVSMRVANMAHRGNQGGVSLQKRLRYAQWVIPPVAFHLFAGGISLLALPVALRFVPLLTPLALLLGPMVMNGFLNLAVQRRFKRFDADYPQFLMSLVGLLKTGMTAMGAIESAAQGLDEGSLVKEETEVMIERVRFGVSEDKSIGAFGEEIAHPEIELFVQALLLSRRVGGTLSETLERLAKQVRRRQHFRTSALSAVGMQRGSIWVIVAIIIGIEGYLWYMVPNLVNEALAHPIGQMAWQGAFLLLVTGVYWVRKVTQIRV